jgi:hypothetical protein
MEATRMITVTGGAPDARRDEQEGAESASTLMDTDLLDYEEDTDERVLDEDSGDETVDMPRHTEDTALSQDKANESPAKNPEEKAKKNRSQGNTGENGDSRIRKGT